MPSARRECYERSPSLRPIRTNGNFDKIRIIGCVGPLVVVELSELSIKELRIGCNSCDMGTLAEGFLMI